MSRYKQLTVSKNKFLEELLLMDEEHNFLTAVECNYLIDICDDGRYLSEDSKWINELIARHKNTYIKLKKEQKKE